jgi:hypothetical protein
MKSLNGFRGSMHHACLPYCLCVLPLLVVYRGGVHVAQQHIPSTDIVVTPQPPFPIRHHLPQLGAVIAAFRSHVYLSQYLQFAYWCLQVEITDIHSLPHSPMNSPIRSFHEIAGLGFGPSFPEHVQALEEMNLNTIALADPCQVEGKPKRTHRKLTIRTRSFLSEEGDLQESPPFKKAHYLIVAGMNQESLSFLRT